MSSFTKLNVVVTTFFCNYYDTMLDRSGGPYSSFSQSNEPGDKKKLYNRSYLLNQTTSSPVNKENNVELLLIIEDQKKNEMSESIVVNNKTYFFFMCSSNQIHDITKFCCPESDESILGFDTTFNFA